MKKLTLLFVFAAVAAMSAPAQETFVGGMPMPLGQTNASYVKAIELRSAEILKLLPLTNSATAGRVHDIIITHYYALNAWHNENDARLKSAAKDANAVAEIHASLKTIHDHFLTKLAAELTPDQIDIVKDKMVYNKVKVTYDAYCTIIPVLTDAQKAHVLDVLKQAREEAMDGGSSKEKDAIFKKYKGRIANYFSKEGIDEQKYRKEWYAKFKNQNGTNGVPQN